MDYATLRTEKDAFFKSPHSPLTPEQRTSFAGLPYYEPNEALRFAQALNTDVDRAPLTLPTSTGDERQYRRAGTITFAITGQSVTLTVFEDEHGYFLPFRDGTAEDATYGAGRYLEPEQGSDGKLLVDFNLAYNPYCAYNEQYSCPIPPRENRIPVRIEAGERRYR
ncbi:MAG: DUF1684 domain-containing protein [Candidatus Kerfeldbacteria bacterium]|nr:DUF1684 domain-containing protein [Candidatus Kerfeldbacteria bacterium]